MWTKGHELKYWNKNGIKKGTDIYRKYKISFNLLNDDLKNKKIIDIGCGPLGGVFFEDDDLDVTLLDILANDYNEMSITKREIVYGDINEGLLFDDGSFDIVVCTNAIDHIEDVYKGFLEINRILKIGGRAYVHVHLRTNDQLNKAHIHKLNEKILRKYCSKFNIIKMEIENDWVNDRIDRKAAYIVLEK